MKQRKKQTRCTNICALLSVRLPCGKRRRRTQFPQACCGCWSPRTTLRSRSLRALATRHLSMRTLLPGEPLNGFVFRWPVHIGRHANGVFHLPSIFRRKKTQVQMTGYYTALMLSARVMRIGLGRSLLPRLTVFTLSATSRGKGGSKQVLRSIIFLYVLLPLSKATQLISMMLRMLSRLLRTAPCGKLSKKTTGQRYAKIFHGNGCLVLAARFLAPMARFCHALARELCRVTQLRLTGLSPSIVNPWMPFGKNSGQGN